MGKRKQPDEVTADIHDLPESAIGSRLDDVIDEDGALIESNEASLVSEVLTSAVSLFSIALAYEDAIVNLGQTDDIVIANDGRGYRWIAPKKEGRLYAEQQGWRLVDHVALLGLDG